MAARQVETVQAGSADGTHRWKALWVREPWCWRIAGYWVLAFRARTGNGERAERDRGCQWSGHSARELVNSRFTGQHAPSGGDPCGVERMVEVTADGVVPATTSLEVDEPPWFVGA